MRKLKLQMQVSVDGFVAGPNREMDWMTWNWDDGLKNYVKEITEPVDCILLGRVLAQGFINHWASVATDPESKMNDEFARKMHNTSKIVFTKTLSTVTPWANTSLANGSLIEEISNLKKLPGSDIIAYGGSNFVSNLIKDDLIDEYHLFVNPVALGTGMPIFDALETKRKLKLIKATTTGVGIVILCYGRDSGS